MSQHYSLPCPACHGAGQTLCHQCSGGGVTLNFHGSEEMCSVCLGEGQELCHHCTGGFVIHEQTEHHQEPRFAGFGATGQGCQHFEGLGQYCNNCGKSYASHGT